MNKEMILKIVLSVLLVITLVVSMIFTKEPKEKINVYLFWGDGCPHCENAKNFFNNNEEYSKYYNLVEYEVWYSEDNRELMNQITEELEINVTSVPFILIGEKYFSGYSSEMNQDLNDSIKSAYEDNKYIDIIEKVK